MARLLPDMSVRAVNKGSNIYIQMIHAQNTRYVSIQLFSTNHPEKL